MYDDEIIRAIYSYVLQYALLESSNMVPEMTDVRRALLIVKLLITDLLSVDVIMDFIELPRIRRLCLVHVSTSISCFIRLMYYV